MPETFDPFRRLPVELRLMIWEFAIRPASPGAHYFTIRRVKEDNDTKSGDATTLPSKSGDRLQLAVPRYIWDRTAPKLLGENGERTTWPPKGSNPSAYLIDSSLWRACKESRRVLQRHFKTRKWDLVKKSRCIGDREYLHRDWLEGEERMPASNCFVDQNGMPHSFTVLPHQDLFVLRPSDLETIEFDKMDLTVSIGSTHGGFRGLKNIAFEFRKTFHNMVLKEYNRDRSRPGLRNITGLLLGVAPGLETVWFIDYHIKRKSHVPTCKQAAIKEPVFYANDRKFIGITPDRNGDYGWDHTDRCHRLMKALYFLRNRHIHRNVSPTNFPIVHFGFLACELL